MKYGLHIKSSDKLLQMFMLYLIISATISMGISLYTVFGNHAANPVQYFLVGDATPRTVCPGDTMTLDLAIKINRAPMVLSVTETIWSADQRVTVIGDLYPINFVIAKSERNSLTQKTVEIEIPELPAGNYEYRRAAQEIHTDAHILRVPFVVAQDCSR